MKRIRLMSLPQRRKSPYRPLLNDMQWRARRRELIRWYWIKAAKRKVEAYRQWAKFVIADDGEMRMAA